jgi:hypothetical protein
MVVCLIVHSTTLLKPWMTKNAKTLQALIVNSNQSLEKSRFNVCENFCKIQKKSSFAKDLITSTHPKFHAMFVNG